ncbi:MAG: hypothetical protein A2722_01305 [Candidatus Doudnabacteria bacterium RIFCSPHIGHO2_01_FULL_50_11]|uniref:Uncharacterized protein n=1 Tax=Candidatus Doudnabacteria bacterium RIFCSPHIGHO2_01_FULL_50_11 TaxID=1817828 RepID=A0A1F5PH66_9BACT|nr:MAG: hypothetical protein A2722_01305 [Candidatus Doudnabacteria bacterium RIFCSPHIGHO2_01_FULL_50_11]HLC44973.1 hypothetical protein [Patescibacteria group bacterium]
MVSTSIERIDTEKGALVLANGHVIHLEPPEDCRLLFQAGDQCSYAQNSSIFEIGVVRKIRFIATIHASKNGKGFMGKVQKAGRS